MSEHLWSVAVEAPLSTALTYAVPYDDVDKSWRGKSVKVPLGRRRVNGVLLGPAQNDANFKVKAIDQFLEERPQLQEAFLSWLEWLANYYAHPIGQVTSLAYPPLKKGGNSRKAPVVATFAQQTPPPLTREQISVLDSIRQHSDFSVHLLHGVTGSGKTEVYLRLLEGVLANGRQALVLVPEISLTPQLIQRFAARFGDQVAVIHSHLTEREKTNQWWDMVEERKKILIGARSALFCPIPHLGMIIVDEEHEASFKQEEMLKYHARDAAVMLAKFSKCPIVLGSATPSMESWKNSQDGKYHLHEMKRRVQDRPLPQIEVVDLRQERLTKAESSPQLPYWLSQRLFDSLNETLQRQEQAALLLNRRGMAQSVLCESCGTAAECPNCAVGLTLHARSHLICHYCGYHENLKEVCTKCNIGEPKALGIGTEKVEQDLRQLFPMARIGRADRDEIHSREDLEKLIQQIEMREIDLIIGTQMIAKGLDFPGLNLVGLVLADIGFNIPDFRSSERAFQLLTQMSGRAGRHVEAGQCGRVIIQTYNPEHPGIVYTTAHDYHGFAIQELQFRKELHYPPYGRLTSIRIQGAHRADVIRMADKACAQAQRLAARFPAYNKIEVLGPAEAPLAKLRGKFRYQILLKGAQSQMLAQFAHTLVTGLAKGARGMKIQIDVDPYNLM